jgi:hypothetical protein
MPSTKTATTNGSPWFATTRVQAFLSIPTSIWSTSDGDAILLDPGGSEVFPAVFSAVSTGFDPRRITKDIRLAPGPGRHLLAVDVARVQPRDQVLPELALAKLRAALSPARRTLSCTIPDGGMDIVVGARRLQAIPAHYLHSSGNLHLYDPKAKILFSGDVGAALLPPGEDGLFVEDFDRHIRHAEGFPPALDGVRQGQARLVRPRLGVEHRHALSPARRDLSGCRRAAVHRLVLPARGGGIEGLRLPGTWRRAWAGCHRGVSGFSVPQDQNAKRRGS